VIFHVTIASNAFVHLRCGAMILSPQFNSLFQMYWPCLLRARYYNAVLTINCWKSSHG
jgi:hypothetical protein